MGPHRIQDDNLSLVVTSKEASSQDEDAGERWFYWVCVVSRHVNENKNFATCTQVAVIEDGAGQRHTIEFEVRVIQIKYKTIMWLR